MVVSDNPNGGRVTICPCCRRAMDGPLPKESLSLAPLTKNERKVVDALVSAYPRRVSREALVDAVYADDPDGGPLSAVNAICVLTSGIRQKLPQYGWTVPKLIGDGRNDGGYSLERVSS